MSQWLDKNCKLYINRQFKSISFEGLVTPVKSQGSCGSCAAFAATSVIETCFLKAGASLKDLDVSEQKILDCGKHAEGFGPMEGCAGSGPLSYIWYMAGKQVNHENNYPYEGKFTKNICKNTPYWNPGAKIDVKAIGEYDTTDEKIMFLVKTYGSVATALNADMGFKDYASGVYDKW